MVQVPAEDLPIGVVKKRNEGMLRVWKQVDTAPARIRPRRARAARLMRARLAGQQLGQGGAVQAAGHEAGSAGLSLSDPQAHVLERCAPSTPASLGQGPSVLAAAS